ncbi:gas vesicle protein [Amycolatopsis vastitatis]|uniref:Gas vesicle protein GvpA n=1 Tax=Amycolatopsis vastitatis TaxID=1905142 RepID=A0A229SMC5_9PSEU|nr:gas vesicle protein [Amycolatopsis vastitatis]OXM60155.1 gas vesicle protein GvpA [Amycolatopsis vastitatis]
MGTSSDSLADILERVLDKGVVIAGDIGVSVVDVELLTLRIRLFIASAQTAREMGMDWWTNDPFFSPNAARAELAGDDRKLDLAARVAELEARLPVPGGRDEPR